MIMTDIIIKDISSLSASEVDVYTELSERMLLTYNEPEPGLCIVESQKVIERALLDGYEPVSFFIAEDKTPVVQQLLAGTTFAHPIPVYRTKTDIICDLIGYNLTGGILCAMKRKKLPTVDELLANSRTVAILEEVENPTNVGAIIRSAAALNVDSIILTSGCSNPLYRRAARVSMGTVFQIPWTVYDKSTTDLIHRMKENDYTLMALALKDNSLILGDSKLHGFKKLGIILGSEGYGLCDDTINSCDFSVIIPMQHEVDSLNVAAAAAVAFWELCK